MFLCFWTHVEADSHVIAHFRAPTQKGREGKSAPPKRRGEKAFTPPKVGGGALTLSPSCSLDLLLLWIVALSPLRPLVRCCFPLPPFGWGGLACSFFRLCCLPPPLLGGSQKKKAPAQRAHGRKHHYPNEGEAKQPHSQGSGEEGSTTQKEREKSNTTQSGVVVFFPLSPGAASSAFCGCGGRSFF